MISDFVIKGSNIKNTHDILEKWLINNGKIFEGQSGRVYEKINVVSQIENPNSRGKHKYWFGEKLEKYIDEFFTGDTKGFVYTYGNRLLEYGDNRYMENSILKLNQIDDVIEELEMYPNSRRAVCSIYDPLVDAGNNEIPCFQHIQFQLRNNELYVSVLFRSHDIDAWYPNMCGIAELGKYVANQLDSELKVIRCTSNNLHKYVSEM